MGQGFEHADINNQAPANNDHQIALAQHVQTQAQNDAMAPAPSSAVQRMVDVTKEGSGHLWEGFKHSFDPANIIPNVSIGFAIGAATKLLLPETGPVGAVAGLALGAYFLGKPLVETYKLAIDAKTMQDMHNASQNFGEVIGGMPVSMIEGGIGAGLGAKTVGLALATDAATPFVNWKANKYAALDDVVHNGMDGVRSAAYEHFGIGSPLAGVTRAGIIPPHLLEELARRNPDNPDFQNTLKQTREMFMRGKFAPRASEDFHGAREVYDAGGEEIQPGVLKRTETQKATGDVEVDNAFDFTGNIRDFYNKVFGRNSIDNRGMKMISTVNYGDNFENAFWDSKQMTYGRPGPNSPFRTFVDRNVTGHEVTHGVTENEAGTVYRNQAGALNEHFSDVGGAMLDQWVDGQTADQASWLVGKGIWKPNIKGRGLRDMLNPGTAYDDPMIGKDPQPAHMKDYNNTTRDNGGVHYNSGIPNRAFALFSKDVGGNSWERPGHIWYEARRLAGSRPDFGQFAFQTIEAAKKLGYTDLVPKLQHAWDEVGVKPSARAAGGTTIPIVNPQEIDKKPAA